MSRIVLGLDADGVILDYLHGFINYLKSTGAEVVLEPDEVDNWSMVGTVRGWNAEQILAKVAEFSVHPDFERIPIVPGAVEAVQAIREQFDNVDLVAITSAGEAPETAEMRIRNLEPFGFNDIHVLPLGASKKDHLAKLPTGSVFVDDLYKHVLSAEEVGVRGVLYRRPYNAQDHHPNLISCWPEGRHTVTSLLEETREALLKAG